MNLLGDGYITCISQLLKKWIPTDSSKPVTSLNSTVLPTFFHGFVFLSVLQLGYDPEIDSYPTWLMAQPYSHVLPSVRALGAPIGPIKEDLRSQFGKQWLHVICIFSNYEVD